MLACAKGAGVRCRPDPEEELARAIRGSLVISGPVAEGFGGPAPGRQRILGLIVEVFGEQASTIRRGVAGLPFNDAVAVE